VRATAGPCLAFAVLVLCAAVFAAPDGLSPDDERALKVQLDAAVRNEEWSRVADLVPELALKNDKKTWELLVRVVEHAPEDTDCARALRVAAQLMDGRGVQDAVKRTASTSRVSAVRRQLVRHVGALRDWPTLIELIADDDEEVAAVAVWLLVDAKVEAAVDRLIARMERLDRDHGGIWDVLRDGLGQLLGARVGSAAESRARWEVVKQAGGLASVTAAAPGPVELEPADRVIDGTRIVFILDVSAFMTTIDPTTGSPRHERAKRELVTAISSLPEATKINIIAYSSPEQVRLWKVGEPGRPQLHALTASNKREACEFVEGLQAFGSAATDLALERAFDVEGARCFYLLSAGVVTHDAMTPLATGELVRVIDERGKDRRVPVHTLGFEGPGREMMVALARHTGGKYSDIR
jgi:hypothetical protein